MYTKEERSKIIAKRLEELYPNPKVPLDHTNIYTLLVAVILSAQSTDKKVNELTPRLFAKASSPKEMVLLGQTCIYDHISKIGLAKTKAKNIYNMSQILIQEFNQIVPNTFLELESLPGVGHKTASVLMAQAFDIPSFPVDTHIHRLAQRWGLTNGKNVKQTENDLKKIFPIENWNKLHLQIIFYGREYCSSKNCDGTKCHLCQKLFPNRKKPFVHIRP